MFGTFLIHACLDLCISTLTQKYAQWVTIQPAARMSAGPFITKYEPSFGRFTYLLTASCTIRDPLMYRAEHSILRTHVFICRGRPSAIERFFYDKAVLDEHNTTRRPTGCSSDWLIAQDMRGVIDHWGDKDQRKNDTRYLGLKSMLTKLINYVNYGRCISALHIKL